MIVKKANLFVGLCLVLLITLLPGIPVFSQETSYPDYHLNPVDHSKNSPDFKAFRNQLAARIKERDVNYLVEHLDENVMFSFGFPGTGIKGFIDEWQLATNANRSGFWIQMDEILRLGCVYNPEEKSFIAPYVFELFPDAFDPYEFEAVIDKKVPVHLRPNFQSRVLTKLDYSIVRVIEDKRIKQGTSTWIKIETALGFIGYIDEKYLRSPIDYRAEFKKINGVWKITFFIAGD